MNFVIALLIQINKKQSGIKVTSRLVQNKREYDDTYAKCSKIILCNDDKVHYKSLLQTEMEESSIRGNDHELTLTGYSPRAYILAKTIIPNEMVSDSSRSSCSIVRLQNGR